jgi:hypothetical protein
MNHIYYYLNPKNATKLNWIKQSKLLPSWYTKLFIGNFTDLLLWLNKNTMYVWYHEYNNRINHIFSRKTVRVFSPNLLPIYFWKEIPTYIKQHPLLKDRLLNHDLHPLW